MVLAGPSGSGKSHLAEQLGLPTVGLDDFYKDGDDPTLPLSELGIVDWDDPAAWHAGAALEALRTLAHDGVVDVPVYTLAEDRATGRRRVSLDGQPAAIAEGIFAADLIAPLRAQGLLADALCLVHRPMVTFWRRLARDLREGRKPAATLVRRGLALRRREPAIVARHISLGAEPVTTEQAHRRIRRVVADLAAPDAPAT